MTGAEVEPGVAVAAPPAAVEIPTPISTAPISLPETPYKGLAYYSQQDAPFFFGRERETQIVTANLMASRLTLLYGESGVGKSSLLRAGVARHLRDIALDNIGRRGTPQIVVVLFPSDEDGDGDVRRTTWRDDPLVGIAEGIERAVESFGLDIEPPPRELRLDELLAAWSERLRSDLLIVLDQFEEYLLYHEGEDGDGTLAAELPRALARPNLRASFLISIREDALAKLDRFKGRLPTLFDNYLRVSHLDLEGARDAITKPIDKYNDLSQPDPEYAIEPELVDTLLKELEAGRVIVGVVGVGVSDAQTDDGAEQRIETPYLQLVMTRLWKEERRAGSPKLRLTTLKRLGWSQRIVKTHLDETMKKPPRYARYVAARVFHHLVTPSGTKIAHSAADLAAYVGLAEADVEPVLETLTGGEYRILRRVGARDDEEEPTRYEIFHDVLAAPILDWRARYLRAREALQSLRRGATALLQLIVGVGWLVFAMTAHEGREGAVELLFVLWGVGAIAMWLSATWVLYRRWRRRTAWVVPLVGVVASALAPVTVVVALVSGLARLWKAGSRRIRATSDRRAPRASRPLRAVGGRLTGESVPRFAAFVAIIGAGALAAGCFLPLYSSSADGWSYRVVALDSRLWLAAQPLVIVSLIALTAIGLVVRWPKRAFASGVFAALGLAGLAWFVAYIGLADPSDSLPGSSGFYEDVSPRIGAYLGAVGGGFVLVAAAPASVLEIFAAVMGTGRMLAHATPSQMAALSAGARRRLLRGAIASLALAGAALVTAGCFIPYGDWGDDPISINDESPWVVLQPFVPGAAAAVVALLMVLRTPSMRVAAGVLTGSGAACVAFFGGLLGLTRANYADVGPAVYVGLAGGALFLLAAFTALRARPARPKLPSPTPTTAQ